MLETILGLCAIFISAMIASSAGTGGGALYMPAFVLLLGDVHRAVPLSKVTIFGLSLASLVLRIREKHPASSESPLINFAVTGLLEPPTLLGALIGVIFNLILPSFAILLLLVICLVITVRSTIMKGLELYEKEREESCDASVAEHSAALYHSLAADVTGADLKANLSSHLKYTDSEVVKDAAAHSTSSCESKRKTLNAESSNDFVLWYGMVEKCKVNLRAAWHWCRLSPVTKPIALNTSDSIQITQFRQIQQFDAIEVGFRGEAEEYFSDATANNLTKAHKLNLIKPLQCEKKRNPIPSDNDDTQSCFHLGLMQGKKPREVIIDCNRMLLDAYNGQLSPLDDSEDNKRIAVDAMTALEAVQQIPRNFADANFGVFCIGKTDWKLEARSILYTCLNCCVNWIGLAASGGPAALICGDWIQMSVEWFLVFFHISCSMWFISHLKKFSIRRLNDGIQETATWDGGYQWLQDSERLAHFSLMGALAGFCAGALGIGGGLVKGPLMLEMGLNPLSAVATATFMILFTSSSTTLSFALSGRLDVTQAILYAFVAFFAAIIGVWLMNWIVKKYRLQSIVTFFLAFAIGISMLCIVFSTMYNELWTSAKTPSSESLISLTQTCNQLQRRRHPDFTSDYPLRHYLPFLPTQKPVVP